VGKADLLSIAIGQLNMGVALMERKILQLAHSTSHDMDVIAVSFPFTTSIVVAVHVVRCATLLYIGAEYFSLTRVVDLLSGLLKRHIKPPS
jgi:hypothetical protein